jgi:hypothetical protein
MLTWLVDFVDRRRQRRVHVRFRVHRAWLNHVPPIEVYCLNVQNVSPQREVTVTHVWIASDPPVHALAKPLQAQIKPGAQWETWIPVDSVPPGTEDIERLGRARLGDDTELKSVPRTDVPPVGYVPG